jgi:molybdopterin converting factor small subunit
MAITVTWKFFAQTSSLAGHREYRMSVDPDIRRAVAQLEEELRLQVQDKIGRQWAILINGRPFQFRGEETYLLQEGDSVAFVPYLGGGQASLRRRVGCLNQQGFMRRC